MYQNASIYLNSSTQPIGTFDASYQNSYVIYVQDEDIVFNWMIINYDGCCSNYSHYGILIYNPILQKSDSKNISESKQWGPEEYEPTSRKKFSIFEENGKLIFESINETSTIDGKDVILQYLLKDGVIQLIE